MSGIAGGEVGEETRIARIADFAHLTEPDGTVYPHLLADALTALILVYAMDVDHAVAVKALQGFKPGGHRIEEVARLTTDGTTVRFVDDSKATNALAAQASLRSFAPSSVVWIAGGLAKGGRFEELVAQEHDRMKAAVIIGVDQEPMLEAFRTCAPDVPLTVIDPAGTGRDAACGGRGCRARGAGRRGAACAGVRFDGPVRVVRRPRRPIRQRIAALGG